MNTPTYTLTECDECGYCWATGSAECHEESCLRATPENTISGTVEPTEPQHEEDP